MTRTEYGIFSRALAEVAREVADTLHDRGDNVDYALRELAKRLEAPELQNRISYGYKVIGLEPPQW